MQKDDYLDTNQAAKEIHCAPRTLIRWRVERSGPPYVKVGRKVLYRRSSLVAWLERNEEMPDNWDMPGNS